MADLNYWLWLTGRRELAGQAARRVLEYFGTPERVYFADRQEYCRIGGLSAGAIRALEDKSLAGAERILGDCDRLGIRILTLQDADYPERLAAIHQPPMVLYLKGRPVSFDSEAAIAVVGTRGATPYGISVASSLAMDLTRAGALIVSGLAEGIDTAAVRGALQAGGGAVAVLGGGIDVVYPRCSRGLYEDLAVVGALISEYPPGTPHLGSHFPVRNRILSGLSVGVLAVESRRMGGTLYTVGHALDQDREVFAVPGPVGAACSEGTNRLIQEGAAKLVMTAEDVICELIDRFPAKLRRPERGAWKNQEQLVEEAVRATQRDMHSEDARAKKEVDSGAGMAYIDWQECRKTLTDDQSAVMLAFEENTLRADQLVELTQIPARRVLSALTILQVQGYVTEESGKRFRLAGKLKME